MHRARRIRRREEYRRVYDRGVRVPSKHMVVFALARLEGAEGRSEPSRLGVTVTKKVGKAVVRARCRRRIKELFRQWYPEESTACDIVINARKGCEDAPWHELRSQFRRSVAEARRRLGRGMKSGTEGRSRDD